MPKRKVTWAKGDVKEEVKETGELSAKPVPAKVEMKPQKVAGKDKCLDEKVQTKAKGGENGK
uniref:Uncharacterized protein n=1 Tax=Urocitellus parryii TaxID=9999 RepID=A0A8D2KM49_UROPR